LEGSILSIGAEGEINLMLASEPMEEQVEGDSWLLCKCLSPLERINLCKRSHMFFGRVQLIADSPKSSRQARLALTSPEMVLQ
jgi:hypothetical protein